MRLNKRLSKNPNAGDLRRHRAHYDAAVLQSNDKMMPIVRLTPGKYLTYVVAAQDNRLRKQKTSKINIFIYF